MSEYTTGHCQNHKQPGGCQLHNVQCGYPNCDRKPVVEQAQPVQQEPCWCTTCRPITVADMRFVVCPDCGNKRCPKAHNHTNACTGSNEPGQIGSSWEHVAPVQAQPVQQESVDVIATMNVIRSNLESYAAQERKPLTDEQIDAVDKSMCGEREFYMVFARAIEAAHGIKEQL